MTDNIHLELTREEAQTVEDFLCAGISSMHAMTSNALPGLDVLELVDQKAQLITGVVQAIKRRLGPTM